MPLRPPWALAEASFLDSCTRCMACVQACPQGILKRAEGGYPIVDPAAGECTFCGDCAIACEPRALDRARQTVPWRRLAAIGETCLAGRSIVCESCRDACPERALRLSRLGAIAPPMLDASRCTGCGACVRACPAEAIAIEDAA